MPGPKIEAPPPDLTKKGSPNKGMIDSLISTLQRNEILVPDDKVRKLNLEWKPSKLYDGLRKMNIDLNKVYTALFDGPLPPVDGYYLTRINAAALNGPIPESYNLAYTDRNNIFARGQRIVWDDPTEPFLEMGFGELVGDHVTGTLDVNSYLRIGALKADEFFVSQNLFWDGSVWTQDDPSLGSSRMDFINGDIVTNAYDNVLAGMRRAFTFRDREIKYGNFDQTVDFSLFYISDADVIKFASDATADGTGLPAGWPAFPAADTSNLPIAGPNSNGVIGIDRTTHSLVFYVNGLRYRVVGVLF
jgi:hypothetical protein